MKHTPTPWYLSHDQTRAMTGSPGWSIGVCGGEICAVDTEPNARLIVRAVNSHAALVEAMSFIVETLDHRSGLRDRVDLVTEDERNQLRAALALARGEEE